MKKLLVVLIVLFISVNTTQNLVAQNWLNELENGHVYKAKENFDLYWSDKTPSKGHGFKQFERWYNHWKPRVYPSGEMTAIKYQEGLEEHKNIIGQHAQNKSSTSNWNSVGPFDPAFNGNSGIGRVNVIEFHPTNSNIIYIGTPGGGLWKSIDGGSNWAPQTDYFTNLGISDIAIDPNNTNIMYVATGDRDGNDTYGFGLLKTTDGGVSWSNTGLAMNVTDNNTVNRVLIDPTNSNVILVSTKLGIYRSTNAGNSFSHRLSNKSIISMEFNPGNTNIIYAGEYDSGGTTAAVYRSTDNGLNWNPISSGLPNSGSLRIQIAVSPDNNSSVYCLISNDSYGLKGIYKSTNNGVSYSLMSNTPNILDSDNGSTTGGQGWYDLAISVSPTNENEVFVGGINIWKSTNGGANFSKMTHWYNDGIHETVHADQHWFKYNGGNLFIGNDGGVFKTTNGGASFSELTNNIAISQVYRLSSSQNANTTFICGLQDNGTRVKNGVNFDFVLGGDGMECLADHTNSNVFFGSSQYGNVSRSDDGGAFFTDVSPNGGNGPWITPFVMDPNNNNIMYLGDNDIYKSVDNGISWSMISGGFTNQILFMDISKVNSNLIYAATNTKIFKSIDAGVNWTEVTGTLPVGFASISSIKTNPTNLNQAWVTFSSYSTGNKVYKTDNQGTSWTNISGSLPNLPVNDIIYQEGTAGVLFIGTDVGVYTYDPVTSVWSVYGINLPNVMVSDLSIQNSQNILRIGTFGRGIWEITLLPDSPPIANFSATPVSICKGATVSYTNSSTFATSYEWTFEGGTPTTSTDVNPIVTYNIPGTYFSKLIATNGAGNNEIIQSNLITVFDTDISLTALGNATNVYTNLRNNTQPIVVNNELNTIAFIHRQNTGEFSGTSGNFRYDYSTDNGLTWTNNSQILNPSAIVGTNDGRYPQLSIYNPTSNTNPNLATIVYSGSYHNGTVWSGYVSGNGLIGSTSYTENYNQLATTDNLIMSSMSKGGQNTFWSMDLINDGTSVTGFRVYKGAWSGTDVVWTLNTTFSPNFNTQYNSSAMVADYKIAFDESGQNGWVVLLTHLIGAQADFQYYPVFYKTTDGGNTWSAPIELPLSSFTSITNNIPNYPTQKAATAFNINITVDNLGNPHCILNLGGGQGTDYSISNTEWMGACHLHYNGTSWTATILEQISTLRNTLIGGASHDNTPQISRSDNGNFIVLAWTDSDPATTGVDNSKPSMKIATYNVASDVHSSVETVDECPIEPGKMMFLKLSDNLLETATGLHVAGVISNINSSGNGDDMTGHNFFTYPIPNTCTANASISAASTICVNNSITVNDNSTNTSGYTYAWDIDNNGSTDYTSSGNLTHSFSTTGSKTINLTLSDGSGCVTTSSVTTIVNSLPISSVSVGTSSCGLGAISFTDNSVLNEPGNYSWDFNGDLTEDANVSGNQMYAPSGYGIMNGTLSLTDINGCESNTTFSVSVDQNPVLSIATPSQACINSSVNITDASTSYGGSYSWDIDNNNVEDYNTAGNISHTYTSVGNKVVRLTITNGACSNTTTSLINVLGIPTANFTVTLQNGSSYVFTDMSSNTAGSTYLWGYGDGNSSSTTGNTVHTYSNDNPYEATLTLTNSCGTNSSSEEVAGSLKLDEIKNIAFIVYPNPANDIIDISLTENIPTEITIFNGLGEVVYQVNHKTISVKCDVSKYSDGIYYLQIENKNTKSMQKIIIKH